MKKEFEKKLKDYRNVLKGIGILEMVGGITGLGLIFWLMLQGSQTNTLVLLILLFAIAFYGYSIYAGYKLFRHKENQILHSRILQVLQLVAFSFGGNTYFLTSGGYFLLGYSFTEETMNLNFALIASKFQINVMSTDVSDFLVINVLAVLILILLEKSYNTIKEQSLLKESYERNLAEWLGTKPDKESENYIR